MTVSSDPGRLGGRKVVVPHVVGVEMNDARRMLTDAGLSDVRTRYVEEYAEEFEVVGQWPEAGVLVDRERHVEIRVARQSALIYLPRIYSQSADADFTKGFLYIVQEIYDSLNRRLDTIHELFDPRSADPDFLPWLASWLAIGLNRDWDTLQARRMLIAAMRLFPYRGTARAIREFVHIYTGASVTIEENAWPFRGFRIGVHSTVGLDTVILPPMNLTHCFVVQLERAASRVPEDEIIRIHEIIQAQKPAHTTYFLAFSDEDASGQMGSFMDIGVGAVIGSVGAAQAAVAGPTRPPESSPAPAEVEASKAKQRATAPAGEGSEAAMPNPPAPDESESGEPARAEDEQEAAPTGAKAGAPSGKPKGKPKRKRTKKDDKA